MDQEESNQLQSKPTAHLMSVDHQSSENDDDHMLLHHDTIDGIVPPLSLPGDGLVIPSIASTPTLFGHPLFPTIPPPPINTHDDIIPPIDDNIEIHQGGQGAQSNSNTHVHHLPHLHFSNTLLRTSSYYDSAIPYPQHDTSVDQLEYRLEARNQCAMTIGGRSSMPVTPRDHSSSPYIQSPISSWDYTHPSGEDRRPRGGMNLQPGAVNFQHHYPLQQDDVNVDHDSDDAHDVKYNRHRSHHHPPSTITTPHPLPTSFTGDQTSHDEYCSASIDHQHLLPYPWILLLQSSNHLVLFHGTTFQLFSLSMNPTTGAVNLYSMKQMDSITSNPVPSKVAPFLHEPIPPPSPTPRSPSPILFGPQSILAVTSKHHSGIDPLTLSRTHPSPVVATTRARSDSTSLIVSSSPLVASTSPPITHTDDSPPHCSSLISIPPSGGQQQQQQQQQHHPSRRGEESRRRHPSTQTHDIPDVYDPPSSLVVSSPSLNRCWIDLLYIIDQYILSRKPHKGQSRIPTMGHSESDDEVYSPDTDTHDDYDNGDGDDDDDDDGGGGDHGNTDYNDLHAHPLYPKASGLKSPALLPLPKQSTTPLYSLEYKQDRKGREVTPSQPAITYPQHPIDPMQGPIGPAPLLTYNTLTGNADAIDTSPLPGGRATPYLSSDYMDDDDGNDGNDEVHRDTTDIPQYERHRYHLPMSNYNGFDDDQGDDDGDVNGDGLEDDDDDDTRVTFYTIGAKQYHDPMYPTLQGSHHASTPSPPIITGGYLPVLSPPQAHLAQYSTASTETQRKYNEITAYSPPKSLTSSHSQIPGRLKNMNHPASNGIHHPSPTLSPSQNSTDSPNSMIPTDNSLKYMSAQYFKILSLFNRLPNLLYKPRGSAHQHNHSTSTAGATSSHSTLPSTSTSTSTSSPLLSSSLPPSPYHSTMLQHHTDTPSQTPQPLSILDQLLPPPALPLPQIPPSTMTASTTSTSTSSTTTTTTSTSKSLIPSSSTTTTSSGTRHASPIYPVKAVDGLVYPPIIISPSQQTPVVPGKHNATTAMIPGVEGSVDGETVGHRNGGPTKRGRRHVTFTKPFSRIDNDNDYFNDNDDFDEMGDDLSSSSSSSPFMEYPGVYSHHKHHHQTSRQPGVKQPNQFFDDNDQEYHGIDDIQDDIESLLSLLDGDDIHLTSFNEKQQFIVTILDIYEKRRQLLRGKRPRYSQHPTTLNQTAIIPVSPSMNPKTPPVVRPLNRPPTAPFDEEDHNILIGSDEKGDSRDGDALFGRTGMDNEEESGVHMNGDEFLVKYPSSNYHRQGKPLSRQLHTPMKKQQHQSRSTRSSSPSSTPVPPQLPPGTTPHPGWYMAAPHQLTHPQFSALIDPVSDKTASLLNTLLVGTEGGTGGDGDDGGDGDNNHPSSTPSLQLSSGIDPMNALTLFNMSYYQNPLGSVLQLLMPPQDTPATGTTAEVGDTLDTPTTPGDDSVPADYNHLEHGSHVHLPTSATSSTSPSYTTLSPSALNEGYYSRFFREVRFLGSGGFGHVWLSEHILDGVRLGYFAVKKIPVGAKEWLQRSLREVRAVERIRHQNVMAYFHSWLETTILNDIPVICLFILMQYCELGGLERVVFPEDNDLVAFQYYNPKDGCEVERIQLYLRSQQLGSLLFQLPASSPTSSSDSDHGMSPSAVHTICYNEGQCSFDYTLFSSMCNHGRYHQQGKVCNPSPTQYETQLPSPYRHSCHLTNPQHFTCNVQHEVVLFDSHYRFSQPRVDIIDFLCIPPKPCVIPVQLSSPFRSNFNYTFPSQYTINQQHVYGLYANIFTHECIHNTTSMTHHIGINHSHGSLPSINMDDNILPPKLSVISAPDIQPSPHLSAIIQSILLNQPVQATPSSTPLGNKHKCPLIAQYPIAYGLSPISFVDPLKTMGTGSGCLHSQPQLNAGQSQLLQRIATSMASPPPLFLTEDVVWIIFIDICLGLLHLHQNGTAHRDVKLENVLLTDNTDTFRRFQSNNQAALRNMPTAGNTTPSASVMQSYHYIPDISSFTPPRVVHPPHAMRGKHHHQAGQHDQYDSNHSHQFNSSKSKVTHQQDYHHGKGSSKPTPCVYTSLESAFTIDPSAPPTFYAKLHPLYNNQRVLDMIRSKYDYKSHRTHLHSHPSAADSTLSSGSSSGGVPSPPLSSDNDDGEDTGIDLDTDGLSHREKQLRLRHYQKQRLKKQKEQQELHEKQQHQVFGSDSPPSDDPSSTLPQQQSMHNRCHDDFDDSKPLQFTPHNICSFSHALISDFGAAKSVGSTIDGPSFEPIPTQPQSRGVSPSQSKDDGKTPTTPTKDIRTTDVFNEPENAGHSGTLQYFAPEQLLRSSIGLYSRLSAQQKQTCTGNTNDSPNMDALLDTIVGYAHLYPLVCSMTTTTAKATATTTKISTTLPPTSSSSLLNRAHKDRNTVDQQHHILHQQLQHQQQQQQQLRLSSTTIFDDFSNDIWALGVLLYILAFNIHPFSTDIKSNSSPYHLFNQLAVVHEPLTFPVYPIKSFHHVHTTHGVNDHQLVCPRSLSLQLILLFILQKDPRKRPTIQEIISHPLVRLHDFNNRLGFSMHIVGQSAQLYKNLEISPYL